MISSETIWISKTCEEKQEAYQSSKGVLRQFLTMEFHQIFVPSDEKSWSQNRTIFSSEICCRRPHQIAKEKSLDFSLKKCKKESNRVSILLTKMQTE